MLIKTKVLELSKKTGICVVNLHKNNIHTKFQINIFIFGYAMAQEPGKGDDVTFRNANCGIFNYRT